MNFLIGIFLFYNGDWGLGIGDWGLGIGDWAQSPIPIYITKKFDKLIYTK